MKTMKSVLIAIVVIFTTISLVNAGIGPNGSGPATKKVIDLTLQQALLRQEVVQAMCQQLDPSFLDDHEPYYVESVTVDQTV